MSKGVTTEVRVSKKKRKASPRRITSPEKPGPQATSSGLAVAPRKSSPRASRSKSPEAKTASDITELEVRHGIDLREEARRLEKATPQDRIIWALETFPGKIAMSSSFGAQSAVSLHMISRLSPGIPVIVVDTGYLFPETYQFIEQLTEKLSLNLQIYSNPRTPAFQEATQGKLWEQGVEGIEKYNHLNKVQPMNRAMEELGVEALFSGLRRQQSSTREKMPVVVSQRGRVKIHPIIDWTDMDIGRYLVENGLPYHPLWDEGYVSIGDWHTSRRLTDGMTAEETRFFGLKRECGLHEGSDFQI